MVMEVEVNDNDMRYLAIINLIISSSHQSHHLSACHFLVHYTYRCTTIMAHRAVEALRVLERLCHQGDAESCYETGIRYWHGVTTPDEAHQVIASDVSAAVKAFEQGCKLDNEQCCSILAGIYQSMRLPEASELWSKTMKLYRQGCFADNRASSCALLGHWLLHGVTYAHAHDQQDQPAATATTTTTTTEEQAVLVAVDQEAAIEALQHGCNDIGDGECCYYLSQALPQEKSRLAHDALRKACDLGVGEACFTIARAQIEQSSSASIANVLFERACKLGYGPACTAQGVATLDPDGNGGSDHKNASKALPWFERACELRDASGCTLAALSHNVLLKRMDASTKGAEYEQRQRTMRELFEKGCQLGDMSACDMIQQ
jgi:TPR repeat protein